MKLKRLMAVVSAIVMSASAMMIPVSAEDRLPDTMPEEMAYYVDSSNEVWTIDNIVLYNNGEVRYINDKVYCVVLVPAEGVELTSELLGLPEGYEVTEDTYSNVRYLDGYRNQMIATETYEEAVELGKLANKWLEDGLVTEAMVYSGHGYACVNDAHLRIELNDPTDETFNPCDYIENMEYEIQEDGSYWCDIPTKEDLININWTIESMENDERVSNVSLSGWHCLVAHVEGLWENVLPYDFDMTVPASYEEAQKFIYDNAETVVSDNGKYAVVVVPMFEHRNNYNEYKFSLEDNESYKVLSSKTYMDKSYGSGITAYGYDVYVLELNGEEDIDINLKFMDMEQQAECLNDLNIRYNYCGDGKFKVSDAPTTPLQTGNFIEKNGEIAIVGDEVITVTHVSSGAGLGYFERSISSENKKPELVEVFETTNDGSAYGAGLWEFSDGSYLLDSCVGGGHSQINRYKFDENGTYEIKFMTARNWGNGSENGAYSFLTTYNYVIAKTDDGLEIVANTIVESEETTYGDVNFDAVTDLYDVIGIAKYIINPLTLNETEIEASDFNRDGVTDLYDAIDIAKTLIV